MSLNIKSNNINSLTKHLKEVCYEMDLLLVEDDIELQSQLKQFLSRFFNQIDTADDGLQALQKYKQHQYDLVITDLTMPNMNGMELTKKIQEINNTQSIIILSAYFESDNLLKLINQGIDGFFTKPIDIEKTLFQLSKTTQAIYNDKLLKHYNNMLEETNEELIKSNFELEQALKNLQNYKQQTSVDAEEKQNIKKKTKNTYEDRDICIVSKNTKMSASDFFNAYPFELEKINEDLEILEDKFNLALIRSESNMQNELLEQFIEIMRLYAHTVEMIPQFGALAYGIQQLAKTFELIEDPKKLQSALPMLTYLFDDLEQWRKAVFYYCNADDIHYMDNSLISDAQSLQGILDNKNESSASDEIELF